MAARLTTELLKIKICRADNPCFGRRLFYETSPLWKVQAGRHAPTPRRDKPLTYDMAFPPHHIAHRKSWLSWNTSTLEGGLRKGQTAVEDMFIRKFVTGTFPQSLLSEIIIKRQHNLIRIAAIFHVRIPPRKVAFLIGYTEELLGHWLRCIVKMEPVFEVDPKKMVFKYI